MNNAKYVTRRAKRRQENTILNRGTMGTETHASTTAHRSNQMGLKTTKFIQSQPIVTFKGDPPF